MKLNPDYLKIFQTVVSLFTEAHALIRDIKNPKSDILTQRKVFRAQEAITDASATIVEACFPSQFVAGRVRYQPRLLANPKKPASSKWALALDPDDEKEDFDTPEKAFEAGCDYCANYDGDIDSLVVAMIYVAYLKPNLKELEEYLPENNSEDEE